VKSKYDRVRDADEGLRRAAKKKRETDVRKAFANSVPRKKKKSKKKTGRPSKFEERFIKEGEKYATIGLPMRDMAFIWGVDPDTVTNWHKTIPAFSDALKKGEALKKTSLLTAMFRNATIRNNPAAQIFLAKNWLGMRDRQELDLSAGGESDDGRVIIEVVHTPAHKEPPPAAKIEGETKIVSVPK